MSVDGVPLVDVNVKTLRDCIGVVSQEPKLFALTVKENIALGSPDVTVSDERVAEAAQLASATEFISQLQHGFDTNVGDRGSLLSGGQKQRVAIARCVCVC